jgi:N-acyl-L-homoserine lactone synthetase
MIIKSMGHHRKTQPKLFEEMYKQRKLIFHDEKGWSLNIINKNYEIDEFDRDDTTYIFCLNEKDDLIGSVRLLNTTSPHMVDTSFQTMFPGIVIRSPTIWEASRFAVISDTRRQPNGVSRAACEILQGMCLFGLENGISQILSVYDAPMTRLYRRCGLRNIVVGRHTSREHGSAFLGLWDISHDLEASIRSATGLKAMSADGDAEAYAA